MSGEFIQPVKSYVLRSRMTPAQRKAYEAFKDSGALITLPEGGEPFPPAALFPEAKEKYIVEIGFGMGQSLALMAEGEPGYGYIGIEVHAPGVARLLWEIGSRGLTNVRIFQGDAVPAVRFLLPPESVDAFHVFFPDPWPKKRHHKRRLVTTEFLGLLASRLRAGGYVYIVTDWADYAEAIASVGCEARGLVRSEAAVSGVPRRPETAFERKAHAAGRGIEEFVFVKTD